PCSPLSCSDDLTCQPWRRWSRPHLLPQSFPMSQCVTGYSDAPERADRAAGIDRPERAFEGSPDHASPADYSSTVQQHWRESGAALETCPHKLRRGRQGSAAAVKEQLENRSVKGTGSQLEGF